MRNKVRSFTNFLLVTAPVICIMATVSCYQIGFLKSLVASIGLSSIDTSDGTSPNKIPKILHFVHVSKNLLEEDDDKASAEVLDNIQDWRTLHSEWTIQLWTNRKVRATFPDLLPLLRQIEQPRSWVANLLRYTILHRFGGVYLDTDVVPIQRLDPLVESSLDSFTVCETNRKNSATQALGSSWSPSSNDVQDLVVGWGKCGLACNAVIGSKPLHPALLDALSVAYANTGIELRKRRREGGKGAYSLYISGPPVWTEAAKRHEVNVLYSDTFYPCDWTDTTKCDKRNFQNQPTAFAMHKWAKSWQLEAQDNNKNKPQAKTITIESPKKKSAETASTTKPSKYPFELIANAQVGQEQAEYLLNFLPSNGNLLVWGLGNGSRFWAKVTTGRVIFLEDDIPSPKFGTLWYDHVMKLHPELEVYKVHYTTDLYDDYYKFMNGTTDLWNQELDLKLSSSITSEEITWDVILVDAPAGYGGANQHQPGRYQSIYTSLKLAQQSATKLGRPVHVFVDDYNRKLERHFSQRVFAGKPKSVTTRSGGEHGGPEANEQAHFVVEPTPASNK